MNEHLVVFWIRRTEDAYRENYQQAKENASLKAEVERLRKAGDAIIEWFGVNDYSHKVIKDWNKAKEGKPSV